jgi:hypothetical protein
MLCSLQGFLPLKSICPVATTTSTALKWIMVLDLHRRADALSHGDRVRRLTLQEAPQHGELRSQHVAFEHGREHFARSDFDAIRGIVQEHASRVGHHGGRRLPAHGFRFLNAPQRRFDGVTFHHHVGKLGDNFLLVGQAIAIFFKRRARREQKCFLHAGEDALLIGPGARGWLLK